MGVNNKPILGSVDNQPIVGYVDKQPVSTRQDNQVLENVAKQPTSTNKCGLLTNKY